MAKRLTISCPVDLYVRPETGILPTTGTGGSDTTLRLPPAVDHRLGDNLSPYDVPDYCSIDVGTRGYPLDKSPMLSRIATSVSGMRVESRGTTPRDMLSPRVEDNEILSFVGNGGKRKTDSAFPFGQTEPSPKRTTAQASDGYSEPNSANSTTFVHDTELFDFEPKTAWSLHRPRPHIYPRSKVVLKGWMEKLGFFHVPPKWYRRYFILFESGLLEYYDSPDDAVPKGSWECVDKATGEPWIYAHETDDAHAPSNLMFAVSWLFSQKHRHRLKFTCASARECELWKSSLNELGRKGQLAHIQGLLSANRSEDKQLEVLFVTVLEGHNAQGPMAHHGVISVKKTNALGKLVKTSGYAVIYKRGRLVVYRDEWKNYPIIEVELFDHAHHIPCASARLLSGDNFVLVYNRNRTYSHMHLVSEDDTTAVEWVNAINTVHRSAIRRVYPIVSHSPIRPTEHPVKNSTVQGKWISPQSAKSSIPTHWIWQPKESQ